MKIVVLSPHRGDAALSLGLCIDVWLRSGHQVVVLNCFTQSEYAPFSDVHSLHQNDRTSFASALRRREDMTWNRLTGGRLLFHDLDLIDAPQRLACTLAEVDCVSIRSGDRALTRVQGALAKFVRTAAQTSTTFCVPLAVGGHIDHRIARQAAMDLFTTPSKPIAFYEDLPFAARPGSVAQIAEIMNATGLELTPCIATEENQSTLEAACRRKERIAECYDSQIDSQEAQAIAAFSAQYNGHERLWVNEAWRTEMDCLPPVLVA